MKTRPTAPTAAAAALLVALAGHAAGAQAPPESALHEPFDRILDAYVRDGLVYYRALEQERAALDRYVAALGVVPAEALRGWTPAGQLAYWINAYNAFVLRTVVDNYPIRGAAPDYPPDSLRQVPGAFERRLFRAAGRELTLDAIERDVIAGFGDARALLALGRGARGSSRLRSEAYAPDRLDAQLAEMAREVVDRRELVQVDVARDQLSVSALFSWREPLFTAFATGARDVFRQRSPLERAILALIDPVVTPGEAAFLRRNQFRMVFHAFDWRLNDLTGR